MLNPLQSRFRGYQRQLGAICDVMREDDVAVHPTQIARATGLSTDEANRRMASVPELFIRLPKRTDGLTRYRLARHIMAMSPDENRAEIARHARREQLTVATVVIMALSIVALALVGTLPLFTS